MLKIIAENGSILKWVLLEEMGSHIKTGVTI